MRSGIYVLGKMTDEHDVYDIIKFTVVQGQQVKVQYLHGTVQIARIVDTVEMSTNAAYRLWELAKTDGYRRI